MASQQILKFLADQNRPFNANDIAQNVDKEFGKSAVQKALDKLVGQHKVMVKAYGKQNIYCIVQSDATSDMPEQVRRLNRQINEMTAELEKGGDQLKLTMTELNRLQGTKSLGEVRCEYKELTAQIEALKEKLSQYDDGNAETVSDEERNAVLQEREKIIKEYKKRKRLCMDIVDAIMEGYPKTKKQLMEEVGIETDEEAEFKIKE
ncbi:PREDICTED: homologous-pairing protein 2 homolog [Nicrophorus vespilloides]|uniref:Homologous-pairing protein 2 homolog n=1 Tax=Nicrophorus vespilloides TaxID=110193 RepID=A0ABM1MIY5_NICVS|nr:PREDICTED: homologous-pairing protein 2 homolog [Nicrophorus vespilloides]